MSGTSTISVLIRSSEDIYRPIFCIVLFLFAPPESHIEPFVLILTGTEPNKSGVCSVLIVQSSLYVFGCWWKSEYLNPATKTTPPCVAASGLPSIALLKYALVISNGYVVIVWWGNFEITTELERFTWCCDIFIQILSVSSLLCVTVPIWKLILCVKSSTPYIIPNFVLPDSVSLSIKPYVLLVTVTSFVLSLKSTKRLVSLVSIDNATSVTSVLFWYICNFEIGVLNPIPTLPVSRNTKLLYVAVFNILFSYLLKYNPVYCEVFTSVELAIFQKLVESSDTLPKWIPWPSIAGNIAISPDISNEVSLPTTVVPPPNAIRPDISIEPFSVISPSKCNLDWG